MTEKDIKKVLHRMKQIKDMILDCEDMAEVRRLMNEHDQLWAEVMPFVGADVKPCL